MKNNSQVSHKAGLGCRNRGTCLGNATKTFSHITGLICCFLTSPCHSPSHQTLLSFSAALPNQTQHPGSLPVLQRQDNHPGQDSDRLITGKKDRWKNSHQHHPPSRDMKSGSCCLSYYLSQLLLSLGHPIKTPMYSMSPSAPSPAAANSLLLSLPTSL